MINRRFLFQIAFACALVFALVMALVPRPPHTFLDQFGDKAGHMAAFATLAALASLAFSHVPLARIGERLSFLGALIEVVQAMPAIHRDCDIMDWVADTAAIAVVLCIVAEIRRRNRVVFRL